MFGGDEAGIWTPVGHATFTVDDVGRMVRLRDQAGHWHWGITSGFRNNRRLDVAWHSHDTIEAGQNDLLAPTMEWQMGAFWSGNYPSAICFPQQSIGAGGDAIQSPEFLGQPNR